MSTEGDIIGQLDTVCDVESKSFAPDAQGGMDYAGVWTTVYPMVWIKDDPRALSAVVANGTLVSAIQHRVTMRWRTGVLPGMRLNLGDDRYLYIQTVVDEGNRRRWLLLGCSEMAPAEVG